MNTPMRPATPRHVPTLTEVIEVDSLQEPAGQVTAEPALEVTSKPQPQPQPEGSLPELAMPIAQPAVPPPVPDLQDAPIPRSMLVDRSAWGTTTAPGALSAPLRAAALPSSPSQPAPRQPAVPSAGAAVGATSMGATDAPSTGLDEALITQRVLADLQRQIDGMLEYRLRETLAPILARTTEALVRELRQELSKTMKDVVARSVAQEVARQRSRG
jgi:hypothetical protein